jgi:predicted outer membrane repeat protein
MNAARLPTVIILLALLLSEVAAAATLHVPGDYSTIQGAIVAADDGDEIVVAAGTYTEQLNLLGKSITIRSADGVDVTTIDGSSFGGPIIQCVAGEPSATTIEGFRISGANQNARNRGTTHGGGLFIMYSCPTIVDCLFEENLADFGGAIYCLESDATIVGCVFRNNSCGEKGGALRCYDSAPTILSCQFSTNAASIHGGAVANNESSSPMISDSRFCENEPDAIQGPWIDGGGNVFSEICCPADLFEDEVIDVIDLLALLALWGPCPPDGPCPADLNGDGTVEVTDLLMLLAAWGPCP